MLFVYVVLACHVAAVGVFLLSFVSKVRGRSAYRDFRRSVAALGVLPPGLVRPAAAAVVVIEGAAVVLAALPSRVTAVAGLAVGVGLLTAFTSVIVTAMARGARVPCRCFGASETPLGLPHVVRNLVLLAVCGVGLAGAVSGAVEDAELRFGGVSASVAAALVAVLFVQRMDDIVFLFASETETGADSR